MPDPIRHIATYARVSSDEQRDRHTVRNQRSALSRRLGFRMPSELPPLATIGRSVHC